MKDENTYDQAAKELLAKRQILGPILKETVEEFRNLDVETIERECMEEREVGTRYLDPGLTNTSQAEQSSQVDQQPDRITPRSNENAAKGEGLVTFDVFFYAHMPGDAKKRIKLIINLEAQRKDTRYSLTKRAFFYASRLISSQKNRDFARDDYDGICKVYTIWICFYLPDDEKSSINHYELREFHDYGQHCEPREDYDLVNMTIIHIGGDNPKNQLLNYLQLVFLSHLNDEQRTAELNRKYGIHLEPDTREGLKKMCNLSEGLKEQVTKEVTREVTKDVTEKVTKDVTKKVTKDVTKKVTKEVTEKTENRIFHIYALLNKKASLQEISERMKMSVEDVARIAKRFQDSTVKA